MSTIQSRLDRAMFRGRAAAVAAQAGGADALTAAKLHIDVSFGPAAHYDRQKAGAQKLLENPASLAAFLSYGRQAQVAVANNIGFDQALILLDRIAKDFRRPCSLLGRPFHRVYVASGHVPIGPTQAVNLRIALRWMRRAGKQSAYAQFLDTVATDPALRDEFAQAAE